MQFHAVQVTADEIRQVMKALIEKDRTLGNPGYHGTGHAFRCPNGHFYLIGDCGGAVVTRPCPECGVTIGGTGHQLAAGNTAVSLP